MSWAVGYNGVVADWVLMDAVITLGVVLLLWTWVLVVPTYVKRVRALHFTRAGGLALPGIIFLTDAGFSRWVLRHEYEHIRQMRRYSPLGLALILAWHYGAGFLALVVRRRRMPGIWELWAANPLEQQANAAALSARPLPRMLGDVPER